MSENRFEIFSADFFTQCQSNLCQLDRNIRPDASFFDCINCQQNITSRAARFLLIRGVFPQMVESGINPFSIKVFNG